MSHNYVKLCGVAGLINRASQDELEWDPPEADLGANSGSTQPKVTFSFIHSGVEFGVMLGSILDKVGFDFGAI